MTKPQEPQETKNEEKVEEQNVPEAPSFKGVSKCPKCQREMKRGLPMHYKHCKA